VAAPAVAAAEGEYPRFRLGAEEYGIDILQVQEIRGFEPPTRLAGAPDSMCGVLNLRDAIVPIVDLRIHFGIEANNDALTVTVVLNMNGQTVGVVVDSVFDVVAFGRDQIRPVPAFNGTIDIGYITGITTLRQGERERMLILVDIEQLVVKTRVGLIH
jgi:purine-binding chemotaxis protein CheW